MKTFEKQCKKIDPLFEKDVAVKITIYYASRRPELDESLILDCMQGLVYKNDRQVKVKHIIWGGVDKDDPRAVISVWNIQDSLCEGDWSGDQGSD